MLQRAHQSQSIDRTFLPGAQREKSSLSDCPLLGPNRGGKGRLRAIETAESISLGDIIGNREVFALEVPRGTPCGMNIS